MFELDLPSGLRLGHLADGFTERELRDQDCLEFHVFDEDGRFRTDDFLGCVKLQVPIPVGE